MKENKDKKNDQPHANKGAENFASVQKSNVKAGSGNLAQEEHDKRENKFGPDRRSDTIGI